MPLRLHQSEAEPVHAGVDVDGRTAGPSGAAAEYVPLGELVEIADHRPAVEFGEGVAAVLKEAVEHIEFGRRQRLARGARFIQGGDEKRLAAGGRQRPRHRFDAAAIGVGLDHGGAFGRHRGLLELAPVGDDGVEIDGEDAGLGGGCRSKRRRGVRLGRQQAAGRDRFQVGNGVHAAHYAPAPAVQPFPAIATRNPISRLRTRGWPPKRRAAARQYLAGPDHEPPRSTRVPWSASLRQALPSTGAPS